MRKEDFIEKWFDVTADNPQISREQQEEFNNDMMKVIDELSEAGMVFLSRHEAYCALKNGNKISHLRFEEGQFVYMRDNIIYEENDEVYGQYWDVPFGYGWDEGWFIYTGKSKMIIHNHERYKHA